MTILIAILLQLHVLHVLVCTLSLVPHAKMPVKQEPPPLPPVKMVATTSTVTLTPSPDISGVILDRLRDDIQRLESDQNAKMERLHQEILDAVKELINDVS